MFSRYSISVLSIAALLLFSLTTLLAQESISVVVFPDEDSFTVWIPGNEQVSLEGIGFEAVVDGELITIFLEDQPSFSIRFDNMLRPKCFHFMRPNLPNAAQIPSSCPRDATLVQELQPNEIFWIDSQDNLLTVSIVQRSQILGPICAAHRPRCDLSYPQPTPIPSLTPSLESELIKETTTPPATEISQPTRRPTNILIVKSFDENPSTDEAGTSWGRLTETTRIDLPDEYMTISNCYINCGWWTYLDNQYTYSDYECISFEAYTSDPGGDVTVQIDFKLGNILYDYPTVVIKPGTWSTYSIAYTLTDALRRPITRNIDTIAFLVISNDFRNTIHIDNIRLEDCPQQGQ